MKEFSALGNLKLIFGIPCIKVLFLDVAGMTNAHGLLTLRAIIPAEVTQEDVLRCENTPITVSTQDGGTVFSGMAVALKLEHTAQYQELLITARTYSCLADQERRSETFQNTGKTLGQVIRSVMEPCGVRVSIPKDIPVDQMLSRNNETAWEFTVRIANEQGLYVYPDSKALEPHISVGLEPFSTFPYSSFKLECEEKDLVDFMTMRARMGGEALSYQMAKQQGLSPDLEIGVGCELQGELRSYAVIGSRITSDGDLLENRLTLTDPVGAVPVNGKKTTLLSTVLTGQVLEVQGVEVLVKFSSDGPAAGTRWIPYESSIGNYFYCMPNIGDQVFAYYQNDGTIVCLGSKWSGEMPDFSKPADRTLVAQGHMIKAASNQLEFVIRRDYADQENEEKTHITFKSKEGITIQSKGDILFDTLENFNLVSRPQTLESFVPNHESKSAEMQAAFESGYSDYVGHGGGSAEHPTYTEEDHRAASQAQYMAMVQQQTQGNIFVQAISGVAGLFTGNGAEESVPAKESEDEPPATTGIINLRASDSFQLSVPQEGGSWIKMDADGIMALSSKQYEMYGSHRGNFERVELSNQTTRDSILDGIQIGLGIISAIGTCIPGIGWGVAVVANVLDASISVGRGDMIGAGMAMFGVFGDMFGCLADAGKAVNALSDTAQNAQRVSDAVKSTEALFGIASIGAMGVATATSGAELFSKIGQEGWTEENKALLQQWILSNVRSAVTMGLISGVSRVGGRFAKTASETVGSIGTKVSTAARDLAKAGTNTMQDVLNGIRKLLGDPVDPVTGSFIAEQTDFILPDIAGDFRLMRRHQSVSSYEKQLLGTRWVSSLGMRLIVEADEAAMLKDDLSVEHFLRTERGWVNAKGESLAYVMVESQAGYSIQESTTGKTYCYDLTGRLTAVVDSHGNRTEISYCGTTIQRLTLASGQYLDFSYEAGKVSKITDCAGRSVQYEYDGDLLTAVTYPNGGTMRYQYDTRGLIISVTDQNGINYLVNSYDEKGRVTRQDLANGEEHVFLYNDSKRQTTYHNLQSGRSTVYHYNDQKQAVKTEYDDGTYQEFEYDQWGNRILEKNRSGEITRWTYRQDGKLVRQELPSGLIWEFEYDDRGNQVHWWNNDGEEFFAQFDERNNCVREEQVIDAMRRRVQTYQYDRLGRMISMTYGNGNVTQYEYWERSSRVSRLITPEGAVFQYRYNKIEQCMAIQSDAGEVQFGYTKLGARALEIDPLGNTTRYRYDLLSNLIAKVLPNQYDEKTGDGSCYRYEYDAMDHRVSSTDPLGNVFATPYDTAGRLAMEVNPNTYDPATRSGQGIRYEYDTDDRRIKVIYPDGGIRRLKYDAMGNLVKVIEPEQYDAEADDGLGYVYHYDAAGRLKEVVSPDGVVEKRYVYDLRGLVVKEISAEGYLSGETDEARIGTLYAYNRAGWLLEKREPVSRAGDGSVQYRLTQYVYDTNGNRTEEKRFLSFQDGEGARGSIHTLTFGYDKQNRLVRVSDGLGAVVRYEYDSLNRRTRETRLLSEGLTQRVDYHYDPAGRLIEVEQSADQEGCGSQFASTRYEYDRNGNITRIHLPAGGEILREYDAANRLIAETHREERSGIDNRTQFGYDAAGNLTEITDNQGRKTRIAYDLLNREIRRIERDGGVQRTVYDRNGQVVRLIRPNEYDAQTDSGDGFQFTYDAQGRVLTVLSPDGHVLQSNTYDADGRLLQRLDGVGSGVKYEYDLAGAQRRIVSMGGASQELEYDARGRITGIVDGNGSETKYLLDEWGRITGVVKADGSTERYAYNFAGDMVSSTDGEGHTTQYEYNRMGKISAIVDPTGERETYHYDGQGRLIRKTDRNGVTVELGYNLYGAPLFKKEKDGAQGDFYEYTPEGLLKCAISDGMRYAYDYDEMGRMIRKSASGRTLLALEYDKNGNRVRQTDVTGKLTGFEYDRQGQLLRLTDDGQELAAYTYNLDGTPQAVTHGPIRQEYAYDLDKNLTGLTVRSGDTLLSQTSYAYDGNGNRIRKQALDGTTLYQYDALGQLQRVDYPAYSEELFYDKAGNRTRRLVGDEEELYQYDPRNRLMALTRGGVTAPFQYDNAGNLLQDDKARYSYDAFNRTVKVETFDGNVQVNRYDAEGLRHEMEENGRLVRFIFHKGEAVAEQEENSNVIRLIRGSELIARSSDSESARTYYHYASDEMGSTTHIVDENGNVQNRYAYDAWGKIEVKEEAVPNRFTYYGQQIDPITQQYYLRARFYNPVIGRFTQEDTYRGDGLNLYAYCANNPVFYTDPGGYACDGKDPLTSAQRVTYDAARVEGKTASQAYAIATGTNPLVPRMSWNEFQHNNRGYWTKHGLSEAYSRYLSTIVDLGEGSHYLHRPTIRSDVRRIIEGQGKTTVNGETWYYDPIYGDYLPGPFDIGHVAGKEFSRLRDAAEKAGLSQTQFNDLCNDPVLYFMQNRVLNQSHLGEQKIGLSPEQIARNIQKYLELADEIIDGMIG
ncbi:RHS repeat-associated core domain-containing protein [Flavonifractor plautii]|uniref:RHS repeat-associated core domain-containing protein n=3 Tax=Flavonifractor plautii TaxID=292800 RepID=UPI0030BA1D59